MCVNIQIHHTKIRMQIDIIIPIYNAYQYTVDCIESVIRNTDLENNTLILINDKSTDERIKEFLDGLVGTCKGNVQVMHNEVNLGFIGTVNKGMSLSENDVILLNSDTEVTPRWLEKMTEAAQINKNVGTVTSLTNNGTICSVPNFCEDNEIPNNFTVDEYAEVIERTSLKLYPSIPTAVGFCMYIKREVIDKVGLFDAETFGKGYGEENDFCCRAIEHGYYHILADDTFVYHKGSTSFLGDKEKYINNNLRLLNKRYPYYDSMIQEFIQANPLKSIQENIKLQIKLRNKNKNVLFMLHNDFLKGENHPVGGTEYHTKDVIDNLTDTNAFVCYVSGREINVQAFINNEVIKFKFKMTDKIDWTEYSNYQYRKTMEEILNYFAIDHIHIQHLRTHTMDIIDLAKEKELPVYITLHDFYCICPKVNLLDIDNKYCVETRSKEMCRKCIRNTCGYNENIIDDWNSVFYEKLQLVDKIFVPSESTREIIEQYYRGKFDNFNIKIEVREHGVDIDNHTEVNKNSNSKPFRVAFVGGLAPYKGSRIAYDLINSKLDVEWHLFGNIGDHKLGGLEKHNLVKHGRYERKEITNLLVQEQIDLICIFSTWPETYSYTISEAVMAKIPVVVTDIGALGDRVRKYDCGWIIKLDSSKEEIVERIQSIKSNLKEYNEKLANINRIKLPLKSEVAQIYNTLYAVKELRRIEPNPDCSYRILNNYKLNNMDQIVCTSQGDNQETIVALQQEVEELKKMIDAMSNTIGWKFLNYIRRNMPKFNEIAKGIIKRIARYRR